MLNRIDVLAVAKIGTIFETAKRKRNYFCVDKKKADRRI